MSDSSRLSASSNSNAELAKQYRKKYPNDPEYSLFTVHFSAQLEFQAYTGSRVGKHETLQHLELILYSNFLKHLMKHQSKLKEIASSIYREHQRGLTEKLFGEFNKDTPLKTRVINEIHSYAEFMGSSTSTSKTPRRYLFQNNATELQRILAPDYNYRSAVTHVNLSDPFNPIHTTLSYPLFCRVVNTQVHHRDPTIDTNVLKKYNRHDETYKKKYIGHMCAVAETDHEFLLAIISAYGADPRKYPSSVLEMMNDRKFIKEFSGGNETAQEQEPSSMKSFSDLSRTRWTGTAGIDTHLEPGSTYQLNTDSGSFSSTRKRGDNMDQQTGNANDIDILSQDEFNKSLEKPWTEYHGAKFAINLSDNCYLEFKSGFPYPNNREGILKNCLDVLIWDCELNLWDPGTFKIKRLADSFPNHVKPIEQDLLKALPNSSYKAQNPDTAYNLMKNNRSLLQLALLSQMNDSDAGNITSSATSIPSDWSPIQSYLPFETFKTLIFKMAKKDSFSPSIFPDIDLEILKLRYVEYMSVNLQNQMNQQFLLGVFQAYGHDVTLYPIRVLQLMKQKELLRPLTVLDDLIGLLTPSADAYEQIFENGISIPKQLQLIPAPMLDVVTKTSSVGVNSKNKSNESQGKSVPPSVSASGTTASNGIKQPTPSASPAPTQPNPVVTWGKGDSVHTITSEMFRDSVTSLWKAFYGKKLPEMPPTWYGLFKSQFPEVNNNHGILDTCIAVLLQDQRDIKQSKPYEVPRLQPELENLFWQIEKDFTILNPGKTKMETYGWQNLMLGSKSLLQQGIIKPSLDGQSVPLGKAWDPSLCSLPFQCFVAHIRWYLSTTNKGDLKGIPDIILKLRYVEYLSIRSRKTAQFLLGLLTAYGPNILNYPIRVLQILHKRALLDSSKRLCSVVASINWPNTDYIDIFNTPPLQMNVQNIRERRASSTSSTTSTIPPLLALQPHSSRDLTQVLPPLPIPAPAKSHTTWNGNNNLNPEDLTISSAMFFESVSPSWKQFYGEENNKSVPGNWFSRYKSQFPEPNNGNGILDDCIALLLHNRVTIGDDGAAVIPRFATAFSDGFKNIEQNLRLAVPKLPKVERSPGSGYYHHLMSNNKSLLQAALVAPVELNPRSSNAPKNPAAVFQPTDWCPSRCVFPFPAFEAHVKWYVERNEGHTLDLDTEVMKLRFVEYVSSFMVNTNQFLLCVFSAYGPHVLNYPVRVLEILKQRKLLRPGTKLFDVIKPTVEGVYCPLVTVPLSKAANGVTQPTTSKQNSLTVDCKSESFPSSASSSPVPPKPKSASTPLLPERTFSDWRKECEKALKEIRKDCHIPLDIPEEYFEELYERYSELAGGDLTNSNAFRLFILGVWTGSHLMNFKSQDTPEPTPSRPESRLNSESSSFSRSQSEGMNERMTVAVAREVTAYAGTGRSRSGSAAESSVALERSLVSCFPGTGELRIDDAGVRLIQSFGSTLRQSVEIIHNSFVRARKLELETLDRIEDEFSGVGMREFVKELSWRICWLSNEDDIKLTANLIQKLVEKKLISQPYVIDSVRRGVIKNLPELLVKILNVTGRVSSFLAYLFLGEDDFCWFITLTEDLRRDFVPVWMDLFKKTTEVLKRKTSEVAVRELFSRTPGAQDIIG